MSKNQSKKGFILIIDDNPQTMKTLEILEEKNKKAAINWILKNKSNTIK